MPCIYKTINLVNSKIYVGQDSKDDPKYLGSGLLLHRAIRKHGKNNFKKEILEYCSSKKFLNEREKFWISFFNSTDLSIGYNITSGSFGGDTISNHPERKTIVEKIRLAGIGRKSSKESIKKRIQNTDFTNIIKRLSGRTWEEIYGEDKARQMKQNHSKVFKGRKRPDITEYLKIKIPYDKKIKIIKLYFKEFSVDEIKKQFPWNREVIYNFLKENGLCVSNGYKGHRGRIERLNWIRKNKYRIKEFKKAV